MDCLNRIYVQHNVSLACVVYVTLTKLTADYTTPILRVGDPEIKKVFPGQAIQPNE